MHKGKVNQLSQGGCVGEPDGQVTIVAQPGPRLVFWKDDGFTVTHQVGQTVVTALDVKGAAAVTEVVVLGKDQRMILAVYEVLNQADVQEAKEEELVFIEGH